MKEGVLKKVLTPEEKFVKFERMQSYVVPAGKRHQIIHNKKKDDVGIAVSSNGRKDFRQYETEKVYWFTGPYAYVTSKPMDSLGISVDLSRLV
jgi:hypothetical protein